MTTFNIEFQASCETKFGQRVCICGNLPELGSWTPSNGLLLQTDDKKFPCWTTKSPLKVRQSVQVEFKMCIVDSSNKLIRWQQIRGNRVFSPRGSLIIEFSDSDGSIIFNTPRHYSNHSLRVQNVRKGTEQVINEWGSDSSSNREMWREHEYQDQQESELLLTKFTGELKRAGASQKQQTYAALQPQPEMQLHNQLNFGTCTHHFHNTHYFFTPHPNTYIPPPELYEQGQKIIFLQDETLQNFKTVKSDEVSLFHIIGWENTKIKQKITKIKNCLNQAINKDWRGLFLIYLSSSMEDRQMKELITDGIDVVVCQNIDTIRWAVDIMAQQKYVIKSGLQDQFNVEIGPSKHLKIVYYPVEHANFIADIEENLCQIRDKILGGFYFSFAQTEFQRKLRETLSMIRLNKSHCLIILNLNRLQQLHANTINQIVHLPSKRFKIIVFVITKQKFPKNFHHKIPVTKNKMIFINTHGEFYANNNRINNIFYFLQISEKGFQFNQNVVSQAVGNGVKKIHKVSENSLQLDFTNDALGKVLKERTLKCIKDINNKSIAKLMAQVQQNSIQLIPFCLHVSFLFKVIIRTFSNRLRSFQKGLIICIDGGDLKSQRYLLTPEGRELNLKFLNFSLQHVKSRKNYSCNPINESQLQRLIQIMSQQIQEDSTPKKQGNNEVKNLRS